MAFRTPVPRRSPHFHSGSSHSRSATSSSHRSTSQPSQRRSSVPRSVPNGPTQSRLSQTPVTPTHSTGTTTGSGRRSRAASSIGASEGHQIICAVSEARGVAPSVGIAFVNVSTGEAVLSQICDNQSYVKTTHKLTVFEPSRILIVSTACPPNQKSSLCATVEEELPGVPIVALDRKYWSETAGLEFIQALAFKEDVEAIKVAIQGNFYATCSFSAVGAIEFEENELRNLIRVGYEISRNGVLTQNLGSFFTNQISAIGRIYDDQSSHHPFVGANTKPSEPFIQGLPFWPAESDQDSDGKTNAAE